MLLHQQLLNKFCSEAAMYQRDDGSFQSGENGPHAHYVTPVRNTAHYAIAYGYLYSLTGDARWKVIAMKARDYLHSTAARPLNGAFWCRRQDYKSSSNGLIGQAWCIESLLYIGELFDDRQSIDLAFEVYSQHKFCQELGLWHLLELDGTSGYIEITLNQQIWFASMGSILSKYHKDCLKNTKTFMDKLDQKVMKFSNCYHQQIILPNNSVKRCIQNLLKLKYFFSNEANLKNNGYHIFTLCGLARIYQKLPDHRFYKTSDFNKKLNYAFDKQYLMLSLQNPYFLFYNVPGLELKFVKDQFKKQLENCCMDYFREIRDKQLEVFNSIDTLDLKHDSNTLRARIYEIYRECDD